MLIKNRIFISYVYIKESENVRTKCHCSGQIEKNANDRVPGRKYLPNINIKHDKTRYFHRLLPF